MNTVNLHIKPVAFSSILFYEELFQSGFWGYFKSYMEKDALAFVVTYQDCTFPLVVITRRLGSGYHYLYAPRAPQINLPEEEQGTFLEMLAHALIPHAPENTVFIRFDTVWNSPYRYGEEYSEHQWEGPPRSDICEIRMNYFTRNKNLRKPATDLLPPSTVILDVTREEDEIFMKMRQNTRNCIRRAYRKGVTVQNAPVEYLPAWYELYNDTARRKGFTSQGYDYFHTLFSAADSFWAIAEDSDIVPKFNLLLATEGKDILAGIVLGLYGNKAYYLYAGSSTVKRDFMPNYRLQWEAIKIAKHEGCREYDLFGIPPNNNPNHVQHGLYTFKTGFGGKKIHQRGCWDYPLIHETYQLSRSIETVL
ncbi:MAG TPA: peptidoglycan bridge formation glycyltransferase FemA/FemB family protein [Spirochaetota bacterium]|nr:peptidoglycan bridge formation glycyltransferase FemA/FemB family protein [Spirochaetota bacterium]